MGNSEARVCNPRAHRLKTGATQAGSAAIPSIFCVSVVNASGVKAEGRGHALAKRTCFIAMISYAFLRLGFGHGEGSLRTICLVLAIMSTSGCHAPDPALSERFRITGDADARAGGEAVEALERRFGGVIRDEQAERRMVRLAGELMRGSDEPHMRASFRLLDSDALNALSLPAGRVYVTRGLFARLADDDRLAAVLAHEMAHLACRDSLKPLHGPPRRRSDPKHALTKELAADARAGDYLRRAGFPPSAMTQVILLIRDFQPPGWAEARLEHLAREPV